MEDYRAWALAQGAERIARAAGSRSPVLPVPGDWCASPGAGLASRRGADPAAVAAALARGTDLAGSWFDRAEALGGYVNLRLAPAWYGAVASAAVVPGPVAETAVPPCPPSGSPCAGGLEVSLPECRRDCTACPGRPAGRGEPRLAGRYTARRMAALAGRGGGEPPPVWAPGDRELLRLTAEYPARRREPGPALGRYLAALARQLWRWSRSPGRSSGPAPGCWRRDTGSCPGDLQKFTLPTGFRL